MFEKEVTDLCCSTCNAEVSCIEKCECWTFAKKGMEFGYNKANEWHYPSKGEYPKEGENVLCCCKVVNAKFYSIGHTVIGGDTKIRWWASNRPEELEVYAWREIVFPEGVKENEN